MFLLSPSVRNNVAYFACQKDSEIVGATDAVCRTTDRIRKPPCGPGRKSTKTYFRAITGLALEKGAPG